MPTDWRDLAREWLQTPATTLEFNAMNFIDGKFVPAVSGETLDVVAPATGRRVGSIPRSGKEDVARAAVAAERAGRGAWKGMAAADRARILRSASKILTDRLTDMAALESLDQGKTLAMATTVDIPRSASNFDFFAGELLHARNDSTRIPGPLACTINYTAYKPIGVVGLVTPWNLPLYLLSWKVAPALAMGNTIVAKPSEMTPFTATVLAEVLKEAGLPDGVYNVVHGLGHECGQAVLEHPDIKAISFTGGTSTGRIVARVASPMFKKISLELGGKNATIVFADCDLERALTGAVRAGFTNQGEICLCGSRVLVERSLYATFLKKFVERVRKFTVGDPRSVHTLCGAVNSKAHMEKILSYIKLAEELGGKIECGGTVKPVLPAPFDEGYYVRPTVISGLPHDSRVSTEEIFGPVVTVHPFDTVADAVAIANETEYGLAASVWTNDINTGHMVAHALDTGLVWVNCWMVRDLRSPFGGMKASGVGREGGRYSMEFFSENKNICVDIHGGPLTASL